MWQRHKLPSAEDSRKERLLTEGVGFEMGLKIGQIMIQETAPIIRDLTGWNVELRDS